MRYSPFACFTGGIQGPYHLRANGDAAGEGGISNIIYPFDNQ
jgi:hypothetical protein